MPGQKVNRSELAALLGRDVNTIDGYVAKGMPYISRADRARGIQWVFDTAAVIKWLQDLAAMNSAGTDLESKVEMAEAQRRKAVAEAQMQELELQKRRGEVLDAAVVEKAGVDSYSNCKARLMAMSTKLAPLVAAEGDVKKCRALIETEVYQALNELGRYETADIGGEPPADAAGGDEVAASPSSSAKTNRKRMGRPGKKIKR